MSRNARVILIETEVRETFSVRIGSDYLLRIYCEACGGDHDMIDINAAVTATGLSASDLLERITAGAIHSPQTASGHLLICLSSLKQQPDLENRDYEIATHLNLDGLHKTRLGES